MGGRGTIWEGEAQYGRARLLPSRDTVSLFRGTGSAAASPSPNAYKSEDSSKWRPYYRILASRQRLESSIARLVLCQSLILGLAGKSCQVPKAGTALRVLRTFGT